MTRKNRNTGFLLISCALLLLGLSNSYCQSDNPEKARKEANRYISEAEEALSDNNFVTAEASYRKAIAKDPANTTAKYNFGNLYYNKEKTLSAEERLKEASEIAETKEDKHRIFHNLGNSFMKKEDYTSAVEAYKNALRANPSDEETRYNLALAKQKKDEQQGEQDNQNDDNSQDNQDQNEQQNKDQQQDDNGEGGDEQNEDQKPQDEGENESDEKEGDQNEKNQKQPEDGENEKKEQGDQEKQQQQKPAAGKLSPQQIQNLLEAMNNEEKKVQDKLNEKKAKAVQIKTEKDW